MECLGVCPPASVRLSYLGSTSCASYSDPLVARRQPLVVQHSLAPIPFRLLGYTPFSGSLDTDPGQLAQKRILPHWLTQFHRRFRPLITQKGHTCTLFALPFLPHLLLNSQSRGEHDGYLNQKREGIHLLSLCSSNDHSLLSDFSELFVSVGFSVLLLSDFVSRAALPDGDLWSVA